MSLKGSNKTEYQREYMRKRRGHKALQSEGVTETKDVTLSDGQVFNRINQPKPDLTLWPGWKIAALRRCNEADKMIPLMGECALVGSLKAKYTL